MVEAVCYAAVRAAGASGGGGAAFRGRKMVCQSGARGRGGGGPSGGAGQALHVRDPPNCASLGVPVRDWAVSQT
eukprot:6123514-Pyramimonas_sp.AAC.1